ncbi:AraC family transcriptional regulator [Clostridium sardiniense]|uniref:AraC family transcriptional regulator n=1 Tax=Clostridium sardiniense TaxID=29369 RepID=UPI00195810AC|nr:AraC family transcriptional regulator [Clostridium sardiniense]MBM7833115.1 AraC family transcriptional regulator [Clostridium sardiniense]
MNGWNEGITNAIAYIEENLTEDIDINEIADKAYVSSFYFQKIFNVLCGFTVGEYIRNRRLTLAAQELCSSNIKVIDVALKYGYDSPDSFARAFTKFHGISPSTARKKGSKLNSFAPLKIKLTLEGGTMLEYKIAEKAQFTVMGRLRKFNTETSYGEIPKFWQEHMESGESKVVCGMYGICMDSDGKHFDYLIADNYIPGNEIPEGYETKVIPAGTWAIFPCRGALPRALQDVNTKIWSEWLPSCKAYKLAGNYNIEMYTPLCGNPDDEYNEIWIPVEKV